MAEDFEDPREVVWHPRFASRVAGHDGAREDFMSAFASGRPHHAWLVTGPLGIGKATLAYDLAQHVLAQSGNPDQTRRWLNARAHPDMAVLERGPGDTKPRKLKAEISVDDARHFIDFFSHTSSGAGWRVGLVDAADDLNTESANALLKLVEEPPAKSLIFIVCHAPGKLLRTLRSRCRKMPLSALPLEDTVKVLSELPLAPAVAQDKLVQAAAISGGSPGFALQLLNSEGAKAFQTFLAARRLDAAGRQAVGQHFATRSAAVADFQIFMGLLLDWLAQRARDNQSLPLAQLHASLSQQQSVVSGYNVDRRVAVMDALQQVDLALKAA